MKVRKNAIAFEVLVLLGMMIVSGCGLVTVETPVPTPDIAATAQAAVATAVVLQPTPNATATYAAIATEIAVTQATQAEPTATPEPTNTPAVGPAETPPPSVTTTSIPLSSSAAVVNAIRTDQPPTIDGRLDEEVWSQAQPLTYAVHPPANDSTTAVVRLLWDDKYLYAGFDVSDTQVEGSSATPWDGDSVSVIIDNGGQIQEYRHSLLADRTSAPTGYHLKGATTFDNPSDQDEGYIIEMRIPWARTPAEGSTIAADFLSVDHDYNPGGLFKDRDTVFSKISWDGDARVDTAEKSIFLYVP